MEIDEKILNILKTKKRSVLTLHRNPDGDSVGSNLAFYQILKSFGHTVNIHSLDPVPSYLQFVPNTTIVDVKNPRDISWKNYDTFWALDMGSQEMMGADVQFPDSLEVVVIDHHKSNSGWGTLNLIEPDSIATAAVLHRLCARLNISYDSVTAQSLLTGLATDSGFMIYSKDSEPFKIAADLIDKGANFQLIVDSIENELDLIDLQFISKALSSIKIYEDKKVVILPMKYEDWIFFCPEEDKSQMLTRYVRSIKDTNFGVVLIEKKPGIFRLSLRSHDPNFDVSQIALKLAGGGHKGAAGATIESESIDKAIEILLSNI